MHNLNQNFFIFFKMLPKRSTCYLTSSIVANIFMPDDYCITEYMEKKVIKKKKYAELLKCFLNLYTSFFLHVICLEKNHENI